MRRPSRTLTVFAMSVALSLGASTARADSADDAAAQRLFDDGRALVAEGKLEAACLKFEASDARSPSTGAILNLADCYEKTGRTASAWVKYREAADRAERAGKADAKKYADDRAKKVEGVLSTLSIEAADESVELRRDGKVVPRGEWGTPIPIDPGAHVVEAAAPGKQPWSKRIDVGKTKDQQKVVVPALEPAVADAPVSTVAKPVETHAETPITAPASSSSGATQRTLGLVAGAVGIVGLGVGATFGLVASGKWSDAKDACGGNGSTTCPPDRLPDANAKKDEASSAATISTMGFVAGGVLLAGGAVLFLTAPRERTTTAVRVLPLVGAGTGGAALTGRW